MRSPMTSSSASKTGDGGDGWQAQLEFGAELAPLTLGFTVHVATAAVQGGAEVSVKARLGRPFAVPIGMGAGSPEFLGALPFEPRTRISRCVQKVAVQVLHFS